MTNYKAFYCWASYIICYSQFNTKIMGKLEKFVAVCFNVITIKIRNWFPALSYIFDIGIAYK